MIKFASCALLALVASCEPGAISDKPPIHINPNMDWQEKYKNQGESSFYEDGRTMRTPVAGTVAHGPQHLQEDDLVYRGLDKDGKACASAPSLKALGWNKSEKAFLLRGKDRFETYCAPCHSEIADGKGSVARAGYPGIANLLQDFYKQKKDGDIYKAIVEGVNNGNMPAHGAQVPDVQDRWAIVSYVRLLQKTIVVPVDTSITYPKVYETCATCHGNDAEGKVAMKGPALAGLDDWYVTAQLNKFKIGHRGATPGDVEGAIMRPMALGLKDEQIAELSKWLGGLPKATSKATIKGDVAAGQAAYATCLACHGAAGEGNVAMKAPSLTGQADWYLLSQLKKFKSGHRGAVAGDMQGMMMRPMAQMLDEQKMKDVVSYIQTLKPKTSPKKDQK